jgi:co-chaperonin GroES (HSP10)
MTLLQFCLGTEKETPKEAESEPTGDAGVMSLKEAIQNENHGEVAAKEKEDQAKVVETGQASATEDGGLIPHQKHEGDIWICKECGWKYPNAKPSAKVRNNHKKKCPQLVGTAKGTPGGTPDASYEDDGKLKGPKCFPCL